MLFSNWLRHLILRFPSLFSADVPSQFWHSRIMFVIGCSSAIIAVLSLLAPDSAALSLSSASHSPQVR